MTYDPNRIDPNSPYPDPRARPPYSSYMGPWSWLAALVIVVFILSLVWWRTAVNEDAAVGDRPTITSTQPAAPSDRTVGTPPARETVGGGAGKQSK
jgi:hypothetical protein